MSQISDDSAYNLIARSLAGELTPLEKEQLDTWLTADENNQKAFSEFQKLWTTSGKELMRPHTAIDVHEEWAQFKHRMIEGKSPSTSDRAGSQITMQQEHIRPSYALLRIAAAFVAIAIVAVVLFRLLDPGPTYYADTEVLELSLDDGSSVTLNEGSHLEVTRKFDRKDRRVRLQGEAYFDIAKAEQPFIVESGLAAVQVLGTSFNVRALESEEMVVVTVNSGTVRLSNIQSGDEVILNVGESGTLNKTSGGLASKTITDKNFLSWKTRVLRFEDSDLESVIQTIGHTYKVEIENKANIAGCRITVTFENQSLDSVVKVLESTLGLEIETTDRGLTITSAGC